MPTPLDERKIHGDIPEPLQGVLLEHLWDLSKLLGLELPVEDVWVDALAWQLDLPWWRLGSEWFAVTPNQVRADPTGLSLEHWTRAMRTDLNAPVHVRMTERGPVILDGVHRLLKATVEGRTTLPARVLYDKHLPSIRLSPPSP